MSIWKEASTIPKPELLKAVIGLDALFCTLNDKIDAELLAAAGSKLKTIGTMSVGYDHIDIAACKQHGIRIGYTPDVLTDATAELTVALLLATSRRLLEANREVYNGGWQAWSPNYMCGRGLKGSTVGIVGFGRIGFEVAKRIYPFKPGRIVYFNRSAKDEWANEIDAKQVDFNQLLAESDFVIVTVALTQDTKQLFNSEAFAKMKSTAIFVNTSRGGIVDQDALYEALKTNQIQAAGLDVSTPEPLPLDSPLLKLPNLVMLPHIGSADIETRKEMSRITAVNIIAGLKGEQMIAEV